MWGIGYGTSASRFRALTLGSPASPGSTCLYQVAARIWNCFFASSWLASANSHQPSARARPSSGSAGPLSSCCASAASFSSLPRANIGIPFSQSPLVRHR